MADIRISELSELINIAADDVLVVNDVSAATTKKITRTNFLVGVTQNVTDSGDNAVVAQDLTINNDLFVGGNIDTTGDVKFGSLTDAISGLTINRIIKDTDGLQNHDSNGALPTTGSVIEYLNYYNTNINVRNSFSVTTASLANSDSAEALIAGYKGYALYKIQTDKAAWVRVYTDSASRTADEGRAKGVTPADHIGLVSEVVTSGAQTINLAPAPVGFNNSSPVKSSIPLKIVNLSGTTDTVQVTLTAMKLEG